jgi:hypothetical protein
MADSATNTLKDRYGPLSFVVALVHILIAGLFTWFSIVYLSLLPPVSIGYIVYLAISALVAMGQGKIGQVGRGMLIGSLSAPLSLIVFIPVLIIAHAIGPI